MNDIEKAIETISSIYTDYLLSTTDSVNLSTYDEALLEVHTTLEKALQEKSERDKVQCGNCKKKRLKILKELRNIHKYFKDTYWQWLKDIQAKLPSAPMKGEGKSVFELEERFISEVEKEEKSDG